MKFLIIVNIGATQLFSLYGSKISCSFATWFWYSFPDLQVTVFIVTGDMSVSIFVRFFARWLTSLFYFWSYYLNMYLIICLILFAQFFQSLSFPDWFGVCARCFDCGLTVPSNINHFDRCRAVHKEFYTISESYNF